MQSGRQPYRPIVLLAGRDAFAAASLRAALLERGADLMHSTRGAVLTAARRLVPDVLIFCLEERDSPQVIRELREVERAPLVLVGANNDGRSVAAFLEAGAEDFVRADADAVELAARVLVILRRGYEHSRPLVVGPLSVDRHQRSVSCDGAPLDLTPTEFRLLEALAQQSDRVVFHQDLIEHVWGNVEVGIHSLAVTVSRLRRKLVPVDGLLLETVPGLGYRLRPVRPAALRDAS